MNSKIHWVLASDNESVYGVVADLDICKYNLIKDFINITCWESDEDFC